jgi:hypothetical protein
MKKWVPLIVSLALMPIGIALMIYSATQTVFTPSPIAKVFTTAGAIWFGIGAAVFFAGLSWLARIISSLLGVDKLPIALISAAILVTALLIRKLDPTWSPMSTSTVEQVVFGLGLIGVFGLVGAISKK